MTYPISIIRNYIKNHPHYASIGALSFGFIWDSITLGPPDSIFNNIVFVAYLLILAGCIFIEILYEKKLREIPSYLLPLIQFSFGNLAGGLFVVYGQSGTLGGSVVFFLFLLGFILANEFAKNYYTKLSFNIGALYFLLFSYLAVIVPIIIGTIGDKIFLLSGLLSIGTIALFLLLLRSFSYEKVVHERKLNLLFIGSIFLVFNVLYFNHLIPPVPLSLNKIGIYHFIVKQSNGNYSATYEKPEWWQFKKSTSSTFRRSNAPVYCFSSVFAPERLLSTQIYHNWEHKNLSTGEWETKTKVEFPISGGREKGYRGYTMIANPDLGEWRCSVETNDGNLIGRMEFNVINETSERFFSFTEL